MDSHCFVVLSGSPAEKPADSAPLWLEPPFSEPESCSCFRHLKRLSEPPAFGLLPQHARLLRLACSKRYSRDDRSPGRYLALWMVEGVRRAPTTEVAL